MATPNDEMSWFDAIVKILTDAGAAMHYVDIADAILERGLRVNVGATPPSTVNAVITTNINTRGDHADFVRTGRGEYIIRANAVTPSPSDSPMGVSPAAESSADELPEPTAISALGMFWRRDLVMWNSNPQLLGQQQRGAATVDFANQRGVYLLHDGRATIYVGRVTDRALAKRLSEHTTDRLNGRWDRFSWFGVKRVNDDASLADNSALALDALQVIVELEAVLIESLEPPLNRRRGDGLRAVEYIQVEDPALVQKQLASLLSEVQAKMLGGHQS